MLHFLLVDDASFEVDPTDAAKVLNAESGEVLALSREVLADLEPWTTESIEGALRSALVEKLGLKPRVAFGPVRVAISGRRVSPPLFESLDLLGRDRSLARLEQASASVGSR